MSREDVKTKDQLNSHILDAFNSMVSQCLSTDTADLMLVNGKATSVKKEDIMLTPDEIEERSNE